MASRGCIAPILPVTAEQLWKVSAGASAGRNRSIWREFPAVESLDALADPAQIG